MSEPEKYLPMNRAELIARVEALEAALRGLSKMYSHAWDRVDGDLVMMGARVGEFEEAHRIAEKTLASSAPETPPHLRGPIIQAHADTNGVAPQAETAGSVTDSMDSPQPELREVTETNRDRTLRGEAVSVTMNRLREMQQQAVRFEGSAIDDPVFHWHWAAAINELLALRSQSEPA